METQLKVMRDGDGKVDFSANRLAKAVSTEPQH